MEKRTERLVVLLTPSEKKSLEKEAKDKNTIVSLLARKKLFDKVEDLAISEVKGFSTSSLITRTTNDITQVQMLVAMGLQLMIKAPITAIWAITKILNKSWQWSMATGIAVLILLTVISILTIIVTIMHLILM